MNDFLLAACVLLTVAAFVWLGYMVGAITIPTKRSEPDDLDVQRQTLDAEWQALEQARKINDVFFAARDQMRQAEAEAAGYGHGRRGQPGSGYGPRVVDGQWE